MDTKIQKKWTDALRSGDYEQGTHYLRNEDRYCCLGVLCDLYKKETGQGEWAGGIFYVEGATQCSVMFPPEPVREWAGLDMKDEKMLAAHNDPGYVLNAERQLKRLQSHSFEEIAELIETYL